MDYDTTAFDWLCISEPQLSTSSADFNTYLAGPQCIELAYNLPATKNLILEDILAQAISHFDIVIFVDLNLEFRVSKSDKILVFQCFTVQDLLRVCCCVASFVHKMKVRAAVIIDSVNCYSPFASLTRAATKKTLAGRFEHKLIDLLELIMQKAKLVITRKVFFSKDHARIVSSYGSFIYSEPITRPPSSLDSDNWLLLQPLITEEGLVHALCRLTESSSVDFCIFKEPFEPVYLASVPLVKSEQVIN
mmetsp:Transcript_32958/g.57860  ORF Transcript_32958/g.57860 Transcript_32958/m.57860 type:complete len:248 (-) Transcript_32958:539-1282(-)